MTHPASSKAMIAVTLDLEMCRNFPTWEQTHWDYDKGIIDDATKRCTLEIARRVRAAGGHLHCFVLGRTFEQESVEWLAELVHDGHKLGNHTYDHVNLLARNPSQLQHRFQRAPWLIGGKTPTEVIADNIRMTTRAMETRLNRRPDGCPHALLLRERVARACLPP